MKMMLGAAAALALSAALTACGSSDSSDAKTQACRSWAVNGTPAALSMLAIARTDGVDSATGNALVKQLHDEFGVVAGIDGLPDSDFKPFADAAKVFPSAYGDILDLGPDSPGKRKSATDALAAIDKLCS